MYRSTLQDKPFFHKAKNLLGQYFGTQLVTTYAGSNKKKTLWEVLCTACGTTKTLNSSDLRRAKSCGCIPGNKGTHKMATTPQYAIYRSMVARCKNPKHPAWKNYGGRGISVHKDWSSFETFWTDMAPTYQPGLVLDRINNNANYSKENCRWTTYRENSNNKRNTRYVETPIGRIPLAIAAEKFKIGYSTLHYRQTKGVPDNILLSPPNVRNRFMTYSTADHIIDSP
jgi:hypothetical protein